MTWVADLLAIAGALVMTLGVIGTVRLPRGLPRLHAGAVVPIGAALVVGAGLASGSGPIAGRAGIVLIALLITVPLSSHELARLAAIREERAREDG